MARQNAVVQHRTAPLSTDFGLEYATKLFGQETIDSLPKFTRGKNAGKPKGVLHWRRAEVGGWFNGAVVRPNELADAWIGEGPFSLRSGAMSGLWMGRTETLALSACFLGEEGRARRAAELTRARADIEALYGESR